MMMWNNLNLQINIIAKKIISEFDLFYIEMSSQIDIGMKIGGFDTKSK